MDPAVLERRKQSTARLLRRQLATVELNPDLVDEALYDRFLELKNPQVWGSVRTLSSLAGCFWPHACLFLPCFVHVLTPACG